jgi:RNA polymerase sigma factor (sigma-70 family)
VCAVRCAETVRSSAVSLACSSSPAAVTVEVVEKLFRDHNKSLLRLLRARGHASQEAHEVAQEAYVRILRLPDPTTISFLQGYLFQTAANLSINRLVQASRRKELDERVFRQTQNEKSPEHICSAQRELDIVIKAIETLPTRCATAFVMARYEDLSCREIAKRMGLTDRQVRRYIRQATEHCQNALTDGP